MFWHFSYSGHRCLLSIVFPNAHLTTKHTFFCCCFYEQQNFNEPLMFVNAIILPVKTSDWVTEWLCGRSTMRINVDKQQHELTSQQLNWTVGVWNWRTCRETMTTELNTTTKPAGHCENKAIKVSNYCIKKLYSQIRFSKYLIDKLWVSFNSRLWRRVHIQYLL